MRLPASDRGHQLMTLRARWRPLDAARRLHEVSVPRNVATGLLAAIGAVMAALVGSAHGYLTAITIADAAAATGSAAYLALPAKQNRLQSH